MTNEQILKGAVEKAIKNGYWYTDNGKRPEEVECDNSGCWLYDTDGTGSWSSFEQIIFNHKFAKALWGKEDMTLKHKKEEVVINNFPAYKYHLQQMIVEEEPIKYLKKFL